MLELLIVEGPEAGRRLPLGPTPVSLGRSPQARFSFPSDGYLSGMHAQVSEASSGVVLTDMRSTNGSFVNGQRVQEAVAAVGDVIRCGALSMRVVPAEGAEGLALSAAAPAPSMATMALEAPVFSAPPSLALDTSTQPAVAGAPVTPPVRADALPARLETVLAALRSTGEPLYCLVDAAVDPMIYSLLSVAADQHPMQSLYDGESAVTLAPWAPYLLTLTPESPLLRVLLEKGWGKAWASYFVSRAPFDQLRHHFRRFLMVQIEQGQQVYFRFYDPRVLRDFLPTASPQELAMFFGPVTEWVLEAADPNGLMRLRCSPEGLSRIMLPLAEAMSMTQTVRVLR